MAIYTNYGRYLKAKQFKEMLEEQGDTYMVFGLGNPQWDNSDNDQDIPIASYNNEAMYLPEDTDTNQFYDDTASVYFNDKNGATSSDKVIRLLENGHPSGEEEFIPDEGEGADTLYGMKRYMNLCRRLIPPFPCIFDGAETAVLTPASPGTPVSQSDYQKFYITKEANQYHLRDITSSDSNPPQISMPPDTSLDIQYFTEAYIRGRAITNFDANHIKPPVGLLGAVRCDIEFVKDIGTEDDKLYTGSINQFWYGDRYWQTVNPNENEVIGEVDDAKTYIEIGEEKIKQGIYPHHIMFTATVNPRILCEELNIDQYLVPRQIAIYTRKRKPKLDSNNHVVYNNGVIEYEEGPVYFRAYENIFNFGQYSTYDIATMLGNDPAHPNINPNKILNFTLPCQCDPYHNTTNGYVTPNGEFKFLLNDYIRGQVRERHSIDRFGYVVGF